MNNSVEVKSNVAMKVIYSFVGELAASFLIFLDMSKTIPFKFSEQQLRLLVKIILLKLLHEFLDFDFFILYEVI